MYFFLFKLRRISPKALTHSKKVQSKSYVQIQERGGFNLFAEKTGRKGKDQATMMGSG